MSDYYRMITQVATQTGCYPFMYLTDEEARDLNAAQLAGTPYAGAQALQNRDLVFLPRALNQTERRRIYPGWNFDSMYANMATTKSKRFVKSLPIPCRDWAFDDNDRAFKSYDYSEDYDNFERDDNDMARALDATGPDYEDDKQEDEEEGTPTNAN